MPEIVNIPPPEYRYPDCPLCYSELGFDDVLFCDNCGVCWSDDHGTGERLDQVPACGAEHTPRETRYVCVLAAGHKGDHCGVTPGEHTYALVDSWKNES